MGLILLFTYTGLDKIIRWEENQSAFRNQPIPIEVSEYLSVLIPMIELVLVVLLLFQETRWWGYLFSSQILVIFTTYIGLIWIGAFPRVPCSCAGILERLDWSTHFYLNLFFLLLNWIGLYQNKNGIQKDPTLAFK